MKYDYYRGLVSSLVNIFYVIENFETTLYLIDQVVGIDKDFKEFYSMLGKRTYALGKLDESTKCFTKLLDIDDENENAKDMIRKLKLRQI